MSVIIKTTKKVSIDLSGINCDLDTFKTLTSDLRITKLIERDQLLGELQPKLDRFSSMVDVAMLHMNNTAYRIKEFFFVYPSNESEVAHAEMTIEFDVTLPMARVMIDGNLSDIVSYRPRIIGTRQPKSKGGIITPGYLVTVDAYVKPDAVWIHGKN